MPRLVHQNPSYRKHRPSGQAVVTIDGRHIYLGPHGSKASREEYDRIIGEWLANGRRLPSAGAAIGDISIAELIAAYWSHARDYYGGGENNGEIDSIKLALRELRKLYGRTRVNAFGPLALKAVRERMIALGWSRTFINRQIGRIRRMFRWAVANEMVPPSIRDALDALIELRRGKSAARESEPVKPVPDVQVDAMLNHVSQQVKTMIQLQRLTGMRPAEVCLMRGCDLDTTGKLWTYTPQKHKTAHHGHRRVIYLGPKAQELVGGFLKPDLKAYLFSPVDAERQRREKLREQRETPKGQGNEPGTNRVSRPRRQPGERYTVAAYRRAISRGCEIAFDMPADLREPSTAQADTPEEKQARRQQRREWRALHVWHPNQLRHNAATSLRKQFGLEAAQVILGHSKLTVTQVYAEKNSEAAQKIAAEVG